MHTRLTADQVRKTLITVRHYVALILRTFRLIYQSSSYWLIAHVIFAIINGILPIISVMLTEELVNSLVDSLDSSEGMDAFITLGPILILFVVVTVGMYISGTISGRIYSFFSYRVTDYLRDMLHMQATRLDMAYFDQSEYYNKLSRAMQDSSTQPIILLKSITTLASNLITIVGLFSILISYAIWLPVVLVISTIPALAVTFWHTRRLHAWHLKITEKARLGNYYSRQLTNIQSAAEIRLFDLGEYFSTLYRDIQTVIRGQALRHEWEYVLLDMLAYILALVAIGGIMLWMLVETLSGLYQLGSLAAFYRIVNRGQSISRQSLRNLSQIHRSLVFLENFYDYMDLEPQVTNSANPQPFPAMIRDGIQISNVTFTYPGIQKPILENFSLFVPAKKIVAIVGHNGAGKSTLIKLICRFYDVQAGNISIDGQNIRGIDLDALRQNITALFQIPVYYQTTAYENIRFGQIHKPITQADIIKAAQESGAHERIEHLDQRYDTVLGRMFGTVEMSVGEWQRIALARAFIKKSPILLLDEPTSAMDSWAEFDWLDRLRKISSQQTVILITHRFTTAMQADLIYLMKDGQVVETGTHQELVEKEGFYAQSWRQQVARAKRSRPHSKHPLK